ncbi:MAG TPA: hypothetical protein VGN10_04595, partial [Pyrinomonadaceae bacterium]
MPTTKHELLDWLMDVPEDAEIGTDGAGLALLAILGTNVHLLEVGHIPNADELYAEAINQAMLERLRRIDAAGGETETAIIIVTFQGYIRVSPNVGQKNGLNKVVVGTFEMGTDSSRFPLQVEKHLICLPQESMP